MKLYAIVEINDDMYDDFKEWYISADDLSIRYVDEDGLMHYKNVKDDLLVLKPMPERIKLNQINENRLTEFGYMHGRNDLINQIEGDENDE